MPKDPPEDPPAEEIDKDAESEEELDEDSLVPLGEAEGSKDDDLDDEDFALYPDEGDQDPGDASGPDEVPAKDPEEDPEEEDPDGG